METLEYREGVEAPIPLGVDEGESNDSTSSTPRVESVERKR